MAGVVGGRLLAAAVVASLIPLAAAKCSGGGTVQVPGGPEVKVHQQERPEMRRQCPVCDGTGRGLGRLRRCSRCKGFGRVEL